MVGVLKEPMNLRPPWWQGCCFHLWLETGLMGAGLVGRIRAERQEPELRHPFLGLRGAARWWAQEKLRPVELRCLGPGPIRRALSRAYLGR